jgi:excisionase family DNA binding protein
MGSKEILNRLERIENKLSAILSDSADKPYDLAAGAQYINVSKSHLYQLTSKGLIAHYKPAGKKIYFDKADLDEYLRRNRVASRAAVEQLAASV